MRRSIRSGRSATPPATARPANSPSAANTRPGCGPESPIGIGSGGSSSTAPKKSASQRAGFCRVHQSTGHDHGRRCQQRLSPEGWARARLPPPTPRTAPAPTNRRDAAPIAAIHPAPSATARKPLRADAARRPLKIHFQRQIQNRQHQARKQRCRHIQRQVGRRGPLRDDSRIDHFQPLSAKTALAARVAQARFHRHQRRLPRLAIGIQLIAMRLPRGQQPLALRTLPVHIL